MQRTLLILLLALLAACSSSPRHTAAPSASEAEMNELVMYAMSLADIPYRYGGASPDDGFDCSGFVGHVFQHTLKITLPRTSRELSRVGKSLKSDQLRPGDLVFFNTLDRPYSHVGIFVGDGKFVHSPKTGSRIRVEKLGERYWTSRYNGARRIRA